ncbi:uncharacterized protein LOC126847048 [Adelges cooleyi]|uniref:uncharacterized protein LOC126847048 n=1 Tax=Adelges cooleyi TaxID=133065 RepID=UPI00217FEEB7|nr:uncharacterized protein LOC126847048 [Adelges cooleyi]
MSPPNDVNNCSSSMDQIIKDIHSGYVPEVPFDENKWDVRDKKLSDHTKIAQSILNGLNDQLTFLINNKSYLTVSKHEPLLSSCLYLCGEHWQSDLMWSNAECRLLANLCLKQLCGLIKVTNIEELFTSMDMSKVFIGLYSSKLDKDDWKKYPAAVQCFMWMLKCLKMPHLNSLLYILMPLPLKMFDDYRDSNIIIALNAFEHIIENTPSAELSMSGHDKILMNSLESKIRGSEYQLVPPIIKCLLSLISKMQLKHVTGKNDLEWTKFDDVLYILIPRMELESKNEPIKEFASVLPFILKSVGFSSIRWSQRLIPLFADYIMYKHSKLVTIQAIKVFILQTWPRKATHWKTLLTILVKALYDEDNLNSLPPNDENITAIVDCIRTLVAAVPEATISLNKLKNENEFQTKLILIEALNSI